MVLLKIATSEWKNETRDKRELSVCRELGMETVVMAKGEPGDSFKKDEVDGFTVYRFSTRPLGTAKWLNVPNRLFSLFIWGWKAKKFDADIISGHDISGLMIGWLSNIGKKHKAKLVYDSHEFELGRNKKRSKLMLLGIKWLEGFLMRRCAFSIMVNDTIADEVQRIHGLAERPVVVRNIAQYWHLDEMAIAEQRKKYCNALNVDASAFLIMYHGLVSFNRGIENILKVVSMTERTAGIILGNGEQNCIAMLSDLCRELNIEDRILFLPAVNYDALPNYVAAADIELFIGEDKDVCPVSYQYSLPNKFFESIQAKIPMICRRDMFHEIENIIHQYDIGLLIEIDSIEQVAEAINKLHADPALFLKYKTNMERAKKELCWENEKERLKEAYERLLH